MRIALVGAEFEENLAVRYILGALEAAGHELVQVVFNDQAELERAAHDLAASSTELAGFSMVFTYRAREFARLATRARELGYTGHMVAGGHFAAFNADALLRDVPAFDAVAIGEGEEILCDLAAYLHDLAAVRGLVWRNDVGEIVRNEPAVKPPDLDVLPYPRRKQPFDSYLGIPIVNMLSSRGCTHSCAFCSISAWHRLCGGKRFRLRSPEAVAAEMAALYELGVRIFNFHDDNFFLQSTGKTFERVRSLERELDRRGVARIAFAVKARPDNVDEELFAYLKSMGLFRVFLGIEAGTAESLRHLGRGQTRDDNERALEIVSRLGLHACFNLLLLNPDSTLEDFAANVAFLRQHPHNPMNFCRTEIYAGTPLEAKLRAQGRLLGDYWGYDYRIADPRAQRLFEIVSPVFRQRNYGDRGLHHLTMSVDYECHLLARFFGRNIGLHRQVKDYVVQVNLNTCEHLGEIIRRVERTRASAADRQVIDELRAQVEADNRRLGALGDALLEEIRRATPPAEPEAKGKWMQKAVAAGLAAAVTLGSARAGERGTAPFEMAPPEPGTHRFEMAPRPVPDAKALRAEVLGKVLPLVVEGLKEPIALSLDVHLDPLGNVNAGETRDASVGKLVSVFFLPKTTLRGGGTGGRFPFRFSADEVKTAMQAAARGKPRAGEAHQVEARFVEKALPTLAASLDAAVGLHLSLWLDEKGKVTQLEVRGAGIPDARKKAVADCLRSLDYSDVPAACGKRFLLPIPKGLIEALRKPITPPTHIFEMIAPPPDDKPPRPPNTQETERIPMPPRDRD